jgi:DNA-binding transcriptional MerR regulator
MNAHTAHDESGATSGGAEQLLTLEELSERSGMTPRNIRAYRTRGLLPPPRVVGRRNAFDEQHLTRLSDIRRLRELGVPMRIIEQAVAQPSIAPAPALSPAVVEAVEILARLGVGATNALAVTLCLMEAIDRLVVEAASRIPAEPAARIRVPLARLAEQLMEAALYRRLPN